MRYLLDYGFAGHAKPPADPEIRTIIVLLREGNLPRRAAPIDVGTARVKAAAKNVPAWVTVVAWTSFAAVAALFLLHT